MRTSTLLLAPLAAVLFQAPAAEVPRFSPEAGTTLEKSFEMTVELRLTDNQVTANGEVQDTGEVDVSIGVSGVAVLRDRYLKVEEGRATSLERTYVELANTNDISTPDGDQTTKETSDLVGRTVRFTWDGDSESYSARFTEGEQTESLLEDLEASIDFAALLPAAEIEVGESYSPPLELVQRVFDPLGDLHLKEEGDEDDDENEWGELMDATLLEPEGTFVVTLVRFFEEEGLKLAELELAIEVEGSASKDDVRSAEGPMGSIEIARNLTARMVLDLEGKLLWDMEHNHVHSFLLEGSLAATHMEASSFEIGDQPVEIEAQREFEGTYKIALTTQREG